MIAKQISEEYLIYSMYYIMWDFIVSNSICANAWKFECSNRNISKFTEDVCDVSSLRLSEILRLLTFARICACPASTCHRSFEFVHWFMLIISKLVFFFFILFDLNWMRNSSVFFIISDGVVRNRDRSNDSNQVASGNIQGWMLWIYILE